MDQQVAEKMVTREWKTGVRLVLITVFITVSNRLPFIISPISDESQLPLVELF